MTKRFQVIYYSALVIGLAAIIHPSLAATAISTVSVTVVKHLSLANKSELAFGAISVGNSGGKLILRDNGTRSSTGGVTLESSGVASAAKFVAAGEPNASYTISLPSTVTMSGPDGNKMVVDNFSSTPSLTGKLNANGSGEVNVGATLNVNPKQALGHYSGVMSVSVNYN